jgi:S-DNA-T family DNA segregation ATPase FtsK/SpoIIIE
MVLGEGVRARGAEAHRIDINTPGVGWIRHESSPDPIRVRAAYVTDHQIRLMAELHAAGSNRADGFLGEVVDRAKPFDLGSIDDSWHRPTWGDAA